MPIVIGIAGASGSGKTTFAKMIEAELVKFGISVEHINYADPLYAIASALVGPENCPPSSTADPELGRQFKASWRHPGLRQDVDGRDHLIAIGEAVVALDPFAWTNILQARVKASTADVVIISDVRYPERGEWDIVPPSRRYWVCKDVSEPVVHFGWCGFVVYRTNACLVARHVGISIRDELTPAQAVRSCRTCAWGQPRTTLNAVPAECWHCASSAEFGGPHLPYWKDKP